MSLLMASVVYGAPIVTGLIVASFAHEFTHMFACWAYKGSSELKIIRKYRLPSLAVRYELPDSAPSHAHTIVGLSPVLLTVALVSAYVASEGIPELSVGTIMWSAWMIAYGLSGSYADWKTMQHLV